MTEQSRRPTTLSAVSLAVALLALCAALLTLFASDDSGAPDRALAEANHGALAGQLEGLRKQLVEERQARQILASEVELLREILLEFSEEFAETGSLAPDGGPGDTAGDPSRVASGGAGGESAEDVAKGGPADSGSDDLASKRDPEEPVFQLDQLLAAGVDPLEAERVRDIWYQVELQKLELRDLAIREGWLNAKKYKFRLHRIKRDAVEELGECGYDSMLYGTEQKNRVIVRDVLAGSNAERAGVQPGDIIMRYNDRRVWLSSDIQTATTRGQLGETVMVDIERNGQRLYLRVDRGPFGVFLRQERTLPEGC